MYIALEIAVVRRGFRWIEDGGVEVSWCRRRVGADSRGDEESRAWRERSDVDEIASAMTQPH